MNNKIKNILIVILPIALGVFLIGYSLLQLTSEDVNSIKSSFKTANYWWVVLSLVLGAFSHFSRAYRWKFLLEPLGYSPKLGNSVMAVLIAYLLNLVVPRSGEIARAGSLSKYENIPFDKAFGTIVAERIADVIMLFVIISLAFLQQSELISQYLFPNIDEGSLIVKISFLILVPILGLLFYFKFKNSKNKFIAKLIRLIDGLVDGVKTIYKMKQKSAFIFHTIFIWAMYILMFYVVTLALPETTGLPWGAIIVGFVVGSLSMALTNGGLGTYPIFVASAITLYGVEQNTALAFGWIMWTAQTLMVIVFGGLSFILLPVYNKSKN